MKVKHKFPPNIDKIRKVFPNLSNGVVFTYGDKMYTPHVKIIPKHLVEHEKVHVTQQGNDPEEWWDKYLKDEKFRLEQEIEAYRKQYRFFKDTCKIKSRVPGFLDKIAQDLSGKIYGNIMNFEDAKKAIQ